MVFALETQFSSTIIQDPDVQASMQSWIEMECYQLSRGNQLAQMDCLDLGGQQLVRETQTTSVQKLGCTPANLCTISYCTPDPKSRFSEYGMVNDETVFFMPENTEFDIYVPAGAQTSYVSLNQDDFLNGAQALNPEKWDKAPQELLIMNSTKQQSIKEVMNRWLCISEKNHVKNLPVCPNLMNRMLLQDILQATTNFDVGHARPTIMERKRAFNLCQKVRAFIDENLASDMVPTIVDICNAIGISERTLQYAFRCYVDMPPLAYLRLCRLHRVREKLKVSDPQSTTVTAIAMQYGFLHLGRFATEYRQLFNELPSKTLAT